MVVDMEDQNVIKPLIGSCCPKGNANTWLFNVDTQEGDDELSIGSCYLTVFECKHIRMFIREIEMMGP